MPDVPKHAWTHRPRAQGGTDPIPITSGLPVGTITDGLRSQSAGGGTHEFDHQFVYWNDDSVFGYAFVTGTTPKRARYLLVKQEGVYLAKFSVYWFTDIGTAIAPYIQPTCYFPSTNTSDTLINHVDAGAWDDVEGVIYGEQFTAAEADHHQLTSSLVFNVTAAQFGEVPIGIGVALHTTSPGVTDLMGAAVAVVRLGDTTTAQTVT